MLIGVYNDRKNPLSVLTSERINAYLTESVTQSVELVFFDIGGVNFDTRLIRGTMFKNGVWVEKTTEFPVLIMNDCSTSPDRVKDLAKEKLLRYEIPFLSHLIEDKLSIQNRLESTEEFSDLLIPSILLRTFKDFSHKTNKIPTVVLKPTNSGKGEGIFVVTKKSQSEYIFQSGQIKTKANLFLTQKKIIELCKKGNYMIQPFIPSYTSEGCVFHIRVHAIRNAQAKWICAAVIADIADRRWKISNYKDAKTVRGIDFLHDQFGSKGIPLYNQIIKRSLKLAQQIDQFYPFMLDELAFDYALDPNQKFHLFEANTGPEIINFAEEREKERAMHRIGLAKTVVNALSKIPLDQRKGKHFKIH